MSFGRCDHALLPQVLAGSVGAGAGDRQANAWAMCGREREQQIYVCVCGKLADHMALTVMLIDMCGHAVLHERKLPLCIHSNIVACTGSCLIQLDLVMFILCVP